MSPLPAPTTSPWVRAAQERRLPPKDITRR